MGRGRDTRQQNGVYWAKSTEGNNYYRPGAMFGINCRRFRWYVQNSLLKNLVRIQKNSTSINALDAENYQRKLHRSLLKWPADCDTSRQIYNVSVVPAVP